MQPSADADQGAGALPGPREWGLRWFAASMAIAYVALGARFFIDGSGVGQIVWFLIVLGTPFIVGLYVGPMAALGTGVRWILGGWRRPSAAVSAAIGALVGPVVVFLLAVTDDLRTLVEPTRAGLEMVFAPPLVLGGAVAGWLAERRVSPRRPVWWAAALGTALLGSVLWEPVSALLPRYGEGVPSWPPR